MTESTVRAIQKEFYEKVVKKQYDEYLKKIDIDFKWINDLLNKNWGDK
jgi:hypothetical protein